MKNILKRFDMIIGFRLLTLMFSFMLFSIYATPMSVVNHAVIIVFLLIVNVIIILLQREELDSYKSTILWTIEIAGIFTILILTGGINSMYFWMILNPMLIGLNTNEKIHRTQHLILIVLMFVLFSLSDTNGLVYQLHGIQMLFGIIVVVLYSYITGIILRRQQDINDDLIQTQNSLEQVSNANKMLSENIMESVELLEKMAIVEDYSSVIEIFIEYLSIILGSRKSFFLTGINDGYETSKSLCYPVEETIEFITENKLELQEESGIHQYETVDGALILLLRINYQEHLHFYGYALENEERDKKHIILQQLQFIRKLHKIIVAKLYMFQLKRELLIKDEQNRIAEEMHDNVNQQLFALTCQVFNLKQELKEELNLEKLEDITQLIYSTLQKTSKDLKNIIYRMSLEKGSNENVLDGVMSYIENLSSLYNIKIEYSIDNKVLNCDGPTQNNLMRIINETIANAVKHGKAQKLEIDIKELLGDIRITVLDNGIGISQYDLMKKEKGLGISNLKKIADFHNGEFNINSENQINGTKVEIILKEVNIQ